MKKLIPAIIAAALLSGCATQGSVPAEGEMTP
ncbi:lipoprotein [Enterobacter hormaechei]|nr:lipoprotein [Enterobacter hormaechei]